MANMIEGKKILVTGGTGSIGGEIVRQCLRLGASKVIVLSRDEIKQFMMRKNIADPRLETVVSDVRDSRGMAQAFDQFHVDIVYHAAAMKHVTMCEDYPLEAVRTNVVGVKNVVDLALQFHVPKMISISTDKAVYPVNVMGATKSIAERITLNANGTCGGQQSFSCVRFGNIAVSRGSVICVFAANLLHGKPLEVSNLEATRFTMEVADAVNLVLKATENARGGEIFILKMKAFKLGDLVDVMVNRIAPSLNIPKDRVEYHVTGLVHGEKLHEDLVSESESFRTYEFDGMYVVLPNETCAIDYPRLRPVSLLRYSSSDVELISKDDIESIALGYLRSHLKNEEALTDL